VLSAVADEVTVMAVDRCDARPREPRVGKHRNADP
jgi:hypothetical protein